MLTPIYKMGNTFAPTVYAFGVDPSAPEAKGAMRPDPDAKPTVQ